MLKNILISKLFDLDLLDITLGKFALNQNQLNILDQKLELLDIGMPMDYVVGKVNLLDLDLIVNPYTLIPREETEYWLVKFSNIFVQNKTTPSAMLPLLLGEGEFHIQNLNYKSIQNVSPTLIDLGTGTGIIGLYLSNIYEKVYLLDVDVQTLQVTQKNIELNAKTNCQTLLSDCLNKVEALFSKGEKWDLIANLPYLPTEDIKKAKEHKVKYEPAIALYSGEDGLELFNIVLKQIENMENKPINVVFELDPRNITQAEISLKKLYYQTEIWLDQNNLERVLVGRFIED